MKKLLLFATIILSGTYALMAQATLDATVIGRLDGHLSKSFQEDGANFDFGFSSVYTDIEASFGEHVNLVWISHWAYTANDTFPFKSSAELYKNNWTTSYNWVDYAYIDLMCEGWTLRLGKDAVAIGGFEFEAWDWDCFTDNSSFLWNSISAYRWGGSLLYSTPDEAHNFKFQALSASNPLDFYETDPETDRPNYWRPWQFGYGTYNLNYSGEFGNDNTPLFRTIDSFGYMQDSKNGGRLFGMLSLGMDFSDKVALNLECMGRWAVGSERINYEGYKGSSLKTMAECIYCPSEKFDLNFRIGYDKIGIGSEMLNWVDDENIDFGHLFGGFTGVWYPINNNRDLQVKLNLGSNSAVKGIYATLGVTYNHCFHIIK